MTLKEARERKGLSMQEMAQLLGFKSSSSYFLFERNYKKRLDKVKTKLEKACEILGIDINEIIDNEEGVQDADSKNHCK